MATKQFLDVEGVSKLLHVSKIRVYKWVKRGQVPYLRAVRNIFFDPEEIEQWLKRHRGEPEPEVLEN